MSKKVAVVVVVLVLLHPALAAVLVAVVAVDSLYNPIYAAPAGAVDVFFCYVLLFSPIVGYNFSTPPNAAWLCKTR